MPESWNEIGSVMDGSASPETRARLAAELDDPNSELNILLSGIETTADALYGKMPPIIRVSALGYILRCVGFLAFWGSVLSGFYLFWPLSPRALWTWVPLTVGLGGYAVREFWLGFGELAYAGRRTRGTIYEGCKGAILGLWLSGMVLPLGWFESGDPDVMRNTMPIVITSVMIFSFTGVWRGMGWREQLAESQMVLPVRIHEGSLEAALMFPWLWIAAWFMMHGIAWYLAAAEIPFSDGFILYGSVIFSLVTSCLLSVQTELQTSPKFRGGWLTGLTGAIQLLFIGCYTAIPVVTFIAWKFGGDLLFWVASVMIVVVYLGFAMGAGEGSEWTGHEDLRRYVHLGIGLIAMGLAPVLTFWSVEAMFASFGGFQFSRLLAVVASIAAFHLTVDKLGAYLHRLRSSTDSKKSEAPESVPKPFQFLSAVTIFQGVKLIVSDVQTSSRILQRNYWTGV